MTSNKDEQQKHVHKTLRTTIEFFKKGAYFKAFVPWYISLLMLLRDHI